MQKFFGADLMGHGLPRSVVPEVIELDSSAKNGYKLPSLEEQASALAPCYF